MEEDAEIGFLNNKVLRGSHLLPPDEHRPDHQRSAIYRYRLFYCPGKRCRVGEQRRGTGSKLTPLIKVGKDFQLDVKANYTPF